MAKWIANIIAAQVVITGWVGDFSCVDPFSADGRRPTRVVTAVLLSCKEYRRQITKVPSADYTTVPYDRIVYFYVHDV